MRKWSRGLGGCAALVGLLLTGASASAKGRKAQRIIVDVDHLSGTAPILWGTTAFVVREMSSLPSGPNRWIGFESNGKLLVEFPRGGGADYRIACQLDGGSAARFHVSANVNETQHSDGPMEREGQSSIYRYVVEVPKGRPERPVNFSITRMAESQGGDESWIFRQCAVDRVPHEGR